MNTKIKTERVIEIKPFKNILQQERMKVTDKKVEKTKNTFELIFNIIKSAIYARKKDDAEDLELKERTKLMTEILEQAMQDILKNCLIEISYSFVPEADAHVLNAYQMLTFDSKKRKELYNKVKNMSMEQLDGLVIKDNIELNQEAIVRSILYSYRDTLSRMSPNVYKLAKAYKQNNKIRQYMKKRISERDLKILESQASVIGKEEEKFEEWFQKSRIKYSENIRKRYVENLVQLGNILEKFNFLKNYQEREKRRLEDIGIKSDNTDIKEYFNKDFLLQLPIEALLAMSCFWSNRLTKEMEDINKVLFILKDLNLIEQIILDEETYSTFPFEKISNEDMKTELIKLGVIKEISQMSINKLDKEIEAQEAESREVTKMVDLKQYLEPFIKNYSQEYRKYFDGKMLTTRNILSEDIEEKYLTGLNVVNNLYKCKNANVLALLEACMTRNAIQNWGYMEDDKNTFGNFVILGFDIPNFNMPLRIHIPKNEISKFLKANNMENIIPLYKGGDDFYRLGELVKTQALVPMPISEKEQIKKIKIDSKKGVQKARYLEHLKYLADTRPDTFPQRLKTPRVIGKGKKQKIKYVFEKEYIDLETKVKYKKDKNGSYIKIQSQREER